MDHRGVAGNVTEFDGNLGLVIGAGGGSLTLFDAVRKYGGKPANYCEIGGNPSVAKACGPGQARALQAGRRQDRGDDERSSPTRASTSSRAASIKACLELGYDPAEKIAIFRIPGAWEDEGFKILEKYGVEYCDRSVSMHEAARRAVEKIQGAGRLHEHPDRREHHLHRPGHHRARGRQPHARVPRLRQGREGRRRRDARPQGPRRARRAGVRHGRAGGRAPRRRRSTARS